NESAPDSILDIFRGWMQMKLYRHTTDLFGSKLKAPISCRLIRQGARERRAGSSDERGLRLILSLQRGTRARQAVSGRGILALVLAGLFLASLSCSRRTSGSRVEAQAGNRPVPVRISTVEAREVQRNVEAVGSLFAYEEVTVSSEVEGRAEEVLVDVGDRVEKSQPLVRVLSTELELTLRQQQAALEMARAKLGLKDGVQDLKDASQAAEVKSAAAQLDDADQKFRRATTLLKEGVLPKQSYDEAEARYKSARAAYDLAVQGVDNLRAQVAQYRASLELAKKKLNDSTIRAPFGGEIKERDVTKGQYLKVQTP